MSYLKNIEKMKFEAEMLDTPTLAMKLQKAKCEKCSLKEQLSTSEDERKQKTIRLNSEIRILEAALKSRQMSMF